MTRKKSDLTDIYLCDKYPDSNGDYKIRSTKAYIGEKRVTIDTYTPEFRFVRHLEMGVFKNLYGTSAYAAWWRARRQVRLRIEQLQSELDEAYTDLARLDEIKPPDDQKCRHDECDKQIQVPHVHIDRGLVVSYGDGQ